jgi:hypothetical protein
MKRVVEKPAQAISKKAIAKYRKKGLRVLLAGATSTSMGVSAA